jgi:ubiquitin carboxyl-terminal hydrolase L5
VALLNIVNNIEGVDLGENLQSFKNFTKDFTPALRGDAINNFEFVKRIHNSFARYVPGFPYSFGLTPLSYFKTERWTC